MNNKLAPLIEKMQSSFWFVPSLMIVFSLLVAAGTIYLDIIYSDANPNKITFLYAIDVAAVRSLLGTIAAAMITVTSIAFSITVVILTLASSQFGPRLMRNFMMDKGTQIVLGTFISTFLFCIVIFCAISFKDPYAFTPGVTIAVAITMSIVNYNIISLSSSLARRMKTLLTLKNFYRKKVTTQTSLILLHLLVVTYNLLIKNVYLS